jgi:predicted ribosomally synthesized peptide with nif11-like leader
MTEDTAKQFIEMLEHDASLQTQFAAKSPNSLDGVVDFASAKGYVFTKEELETALKRYPDSPVVEQLRHYTH